MLLTKLLLVIFLVERSLGEKTCVDDACTPKCDNKNHCECDNGYELSHDQKTCIDYNECEHWPPVCSQMCINRVGSFDCACAPGYHMTRRGNECESDIEPNLAQIVYSAGTDLYTMLYSQVVHNSSRHFIHDHLYKADGMITAIAVNAIDNEIFFFDEGNSQIDSVHILPDNKAHFKKAIVANGLESVSGLAYDWVGRNLYILESRDHVIYVCALETDQCLSLFPHLDGKPRSIAVHPNAGLLFWSECIHPFNRIMVSSMDGRNQKILWDTKGRCASSLVLDETIGSLLWTDNLMQGINFIRINDVNNMRALENPSFQHALGLSIFEEWIFWTSRSEEGVSLNSMPKAHFRQVPAANVPLNVAHEEHGPINIAISHPSLQQLAQNSKKCELGSCSDICLVVSKDDAKCACPTGEMFNTNTNKCIQNWSEPSLLAVKANRILRVLPLNVGERVYDVAIVASHHVTALAVDVANREVVLAEMKDGDVKNGFIVVKINLLDLNNVTVLATDAGHVTSLSFDWISKNVYWVDASKKRIEMSSTRGGGRIELPNRDVITLPKALAVDPINQRLYFSNCESDNYIGSCDLGGKSCERLVISEKLGCISGLIIDTRIKVLYWTDPAHSVIASYHLLTNKLAVLRNSPSPGQLALFGHHLFWTDAHEDDILTYEKSIKENGGRVRLDLTGVFVLASMDQYSQPRGNNACSNNNGGCSGVCVAEKQTQRRCLCPDGAQLLADLKTCYVEQFNRHNDDDYTTKIPVEILQKNYRTEPQLQCPENYCPSGIECVALSHRNFKCKCPSGWGGARCETPLETSVHWILIMFLIIFCISITAICAFGIFKIYSNMKEGQALNLQEVKSMVFSVGRNSQDAKALIKKEKSTDCDSALIPLHCVHG